MKLLYFNDFRLGVLKGDKVVDVTPAVQNVPHTGPGNLIIGKRHEMASLGSPPRHFRTTVPHGDVRAGTQGAGRVTPCRRAPAGRQNRYRRDELPASTADGAEEGTPWA